MNPDIGPRFYRNRHRGGLIMATARSVMALVLREMSTRYGRSPGGYAWALIEPIGGIMILTLAFSLVLHTPPLGSSFVLFYATGFLPFTLYSRVEGASSQSIMFSKPLLRYPAVSWVDALIARFMLNSLTGILVTYLIFGGIMLVQDTRAVIDVVRVVEATALTLLLGLGIGTLNCVFLGLFPVWDKIWGIINKPLVLASCIFYTFDSLPPGAQAILWYNPLVHIIGLLRTGFYPSYHATYVSVSYVAGVSMVSLVLGLVLLGRYHRDILNA